MMKTNQTIFLLKTLLLVGLYAPFSAHSKNKNELSTHSKAKKSLKVFIDPGHGGKDPGAYVDGIKESKVTLKTSLLLKEELLSIGFDVKLSRETDSESVPLRSRVEKANKWKADLVLSIHANSSTHKQLRGAEFFIDLPFKPNKEDYDEILSTEHSQRMSLRWSAVEEELLSIKSKSKKASVATLNKIDQFEKSHLLAQSLSSFWEVHKLPSGKRKDLIFTSPLFMLKHSPIPTVLIELGYLSHPIEQQMLLSEDEQRKFAKKISKGLLSFLDKYSLK